MLLKGVIQTLAAHAAKCTLGPSLPRLRLVDTAAACPSPTRRSVPSVSMKETPPLRTLADRTYQCKHFEEEGAEREVAVEDEAADDDFHLGDAAARGERRVKLDDQRCDEPKRQLGRATGRDGT